MSPDEKKPDCEGEGVPIPKIKLDSLISLTRSLGDKVRTYASGLEQIGEALGIPSSDLAPPNVEALLREVEEVNSYRRRVAEVLAKAHPGEDYSRRTPLNLLKVLQDDYQRFFSQPNEIQKHFEAEIERLHQEYQQLEEKSRLEYQALEKKHQTALREAKEISLTNERLGTELTLIRKSLEERASTIMGLEQRVKAKEEYENKYGSVMGGLSRLLGMSGYSGEEIVAEVGKRIEKARGERDKHKAASEEWEEAKAQLERKLGDITEQLEQIRKSDGDEYVRLTEDHSALKRQLESALIEKVEYQAKVNTLSKEKDELVREKEGLERKCNLLLKRETIISKKDSDGALKKGFIRRGIQFGINSYETLKNLKNKYLLP